MRKIVDSNALEQVFTLPWSLLNREAENIVLIAMGNYSIATPLLRVVGMGKGEMVQQFIPIIEALLGAAREKGIIR